LTISTNDQMVLDLILLSSKILDENRVEAMPVLNS
jgi:hypothetical protein